MEKRAKDKKTFTLQSFSLLTFFFILSSFFFSSCPNPLVLKILDAKTITFETNGGSRIGDQSVYKGYPVKRPSNPSRWGYFFDEWYIDNQTFQIMWDFYTVPLDDTTLYANWLVDDSSLIGMDGKPIPDNKVTVRYGEKPTFSSASGFDGHLWTLNSIEVGTGESYLFDTSDSDKELGRSYILGLNVRNIHDGRYYSSFITIRIPDAEVTIKTQPKLSYAHGDTLDLSELVVTLDYDDGVKEDIAFADFASRNLTVNMANGTPLIHSEHNDQPIIVYYGKKTTKTNPLIVTKVEQHSGGEAFPISFDGGGDQIDIETFGQPLLNNTITVQVGNSVTFSTDASYSDHHWTLNGVDIVPNPGYSYYFYAGPEKDPGRDYVIGLMCQKDGKNYSLQITVKIQA